MTSVSSTQGAVEQRGNGGANAVSSSQPRRGMAIELPSGAQNRGADMASSATDPSAHCGHA
jgi:hypothetical protein